MEHMNELSSLSNLFSDDIKMRTYFVAKIFPFSLKGAAKAWFNNLSPGSIDSHFTTERCADTLIPVLGLDASTPAVPFKCSLLDALDTSPISSSTTSSTDTSSSDGCFCFLRRRRIRELGGKTPRVPLGQPEQGKGSRPVEA
jgi:hypothetical protein